MSCRGKIMVEMAIELLSEKNEVPVENKCVEDKSANELPLDNELVVDNEPSTNATSFDQSLEECWNTAGPSQSRNTIARCSQSSRNSSSSSSTCSTCSGSSSSEDCDDIINDETYVPRDNSDSDKENSNVQIHDTETTTVPQDISILTSPHKTSIKRKKNIEKWKRNLLKNYRNSGKAYESHTENKKM
ncbi:pinin [Ooceraea biroi]|uniref:pinin n=1 Tax=Ooceraea biroi TaxID=2015173 RepID=UPI000F0869A1|nr:pinin [Ooceraea biroi]